MRKLPSLSAINSRPSVVSTHVLVALAIRLPQENRDLLSALVELAKATASGTPPRRLLNQNIDVSQSSSMEPSPVADVLSRSYGSL